MQVLLVEDDIVAARCIKKEFEAADIAVDTVRSATDAMSRTLRATYDLAILDIFVDDGTTISLSNYLRMRSPDTAIMSITGSAAFPCGDHGEVMSAD
ncbi:MAG: response regulator, partial [Pseudomonadota bacterium]